MQKTPGSYGADARVRDDSAQLAAEVDSFVADVRAA
jgi:hypothetical protein